MSLNLREFGVLRDMADYVSTPMVGRRNDGTAVFAKDSPAWTERLVAEKLIEVVGAERGYDVFRVTAAGHSLVAEWRAGRLRLTAS